MIDNATVDAIETAIEELASEFRETPGLLLTEADMKCHLMATFARLGNLGVPIASADHGVRATAIHAEVPWFDEQGHLRLRPDITVTDPSALSIQRAMQKGIPLPRKGFHFTGNSILIELKFYRGRDGVQPRSLPVIRQDIEKIERLIRRGRQLSPGTFLYGFVVVFAKYSGVCREVQELVNGTYDNVKVMVRSAELAMRLAIRRLTCA